MNDDVKPAASGKCAATAESGDVAVRIPRDLVEQVREERDTGCNCATEREAGRGCCCRCIRLSLAEHALAFAAVLAADAILTVEPVDDSAGRIAFVGALGNEEDVRWLIVRQRETAPAEVWAAASEAEAREVYERVSVQWNGCYLARVKHGPGSGWQQKASPVDAARAEGFAAGVKEAARIVRERRDVILDLLGTSSEALHDRYRACTLSEVLDEVKELARVEHGEGPGRRETLAEVEEAVLAALSDAAKMQSLLTEAVACGGVNPEWLQRAKEFEPASREALDLLSGLSVDGRADSEHAKRKIMARLLIAWQKCPKLRLGQLLANVEFADVEFRNLVYIEDGPLAESVENQAQR